MSVSHVLHCKITCNTQLKKKASFSLQNDLSLTTQINLKYKQSHNPMDKRILPFRLSVVIINCCRICSSVFLYNRLVNLVTKFCLFSLEDSMPYSQEVEKELC